MCDTIIRMTNENWRFLNFMAITLLIEEASSCETSVTLYQTTPRYDPENSHTYNRRHENVKPCSENLYCSFCFFTFSANQRQCRQKKRCLISLVTIFNIKN
jgi:hypothetical protein